MLYLNYWGLCIATKDRPLFAFCWLTIQTIFINGKQWRNEHLNIFRNTPQDFLEFRNSCLISKISKKVVLKQTDMRNLYNDNAAAHLPTENEIYLWPHSTGKQNCYDFRKPWPAELLQTCPSHDVLLYFCYNVKTTLSFP